MLLQGVVKALFEAKLLPRVLAGSSAGSIGKQQAYDWCHAQDKPSPAVAPVPLSHCSALQRQHTPLAQGTQSSSADLLSALARSIIICTYPICSFPT